MDYHVIVVLPSAKGKFQARQRQEKTLCRQRTTDILVRTSARQPRGGSVSPIFSTWDIPQTNALYNLLCEDHVGTYALPFQCFWTGAAWSVFNTPKNGVVKTNFSRQRFRKRLTWKTYKTRNDAPTELDIIWDEPIKARCVVCSFDSNGNKGLWMEAAIGQIREMIVS